MKNDTSSGHELADKFLGLKEDDLDRRIGLTKREAQAFSIQRLLASMMDESNPEARNAAGLELAACLAAGHGEHGGLVLPAEISGLGLPRSERAANITEPSAGGFLQSTTVRGDLIIDMLRPSAPLMSLGTVLSGLPPGDHGVPRVDAGLTGGFIATEDDEAPSTEHEFGLLTLSPKTAGASTYMTRAFVRHAVKGSEELIRRDIADAIGATVEAAFWTGDGTAGTPVGLLHTDGLGAVVGGEHGANPSWDHVVALETALGTANAASGRLGYVTNAAIRGALKRTPRHTTANVGGYIWEPFPGMPDSSVGMLNGYPAYVSNHAPADLVKGDSPNCCPILFGNFEDLIIGLWGGLELAVDPYSRSRRGGVIVNAFLDCDLLIRRPASFALMKDALPLV